MQAQKVCQSWAVFMVRYAFLILAVLYTLCPYTILCFTKIILLKESNSCSDMNEHFILSKFSHKFTVSLKSSALCLWGRQFHKSKYEKIFVKSQSPETKNTWFEQISEFVSKFWLTRCPIQLCVGISLAIPFSMWNEKVNLDTAFFS